MILLLQSPCLLSLEEKISFGIKGNQYKKGKTGSSRAETVVVCSLFLFLMFFFFFLNEPRVLSLFSLSFNSYFHFMFFVLLP